LGGSRIMQEWRENVWSRRGKGDARKSGRKRWRSVGCK